MPDVLYILSPSYSGSTLLTFLLATHPDIATVGELKASAMGDITTYHCSCGSLLTQCPFWLKVQDRMRNDGGELSFKDFGTHFRRGPAHFRKLINLGVRAPFWSALSSFALNLLPDCRTRLKRITEQNCQLVKVVTEIQRGRVFLDGSKDPERLHQLLKRLGDKVKVVHLIRDGRGVANSYIKHYQVGMPIAARELVKTNRACDRVMQNVPTKNALTIKYEELCAQPVETLAAIFRLVGLEPEPPVRRSAVSDFHILGNAMRLEFGKPIKLDEKWRRELSAEDLSSFESIAGEINRRHGYISV